MLLKGYTMQLNIFTITLLFYRALFSSGSTGPTTGSKCITAYMLLTCRRAIRSERQTNQHSKTPRRVPQNNPTANTPRKNINKANLWHGQDKPEAWKNGKWKGWECHRTMWMTGEFYTTNRNITMVQSWTWTAVVESSDTRGRWCWRSIFCQLTFEMLHEFSQKGLTLQRSLSECLCVRPLMHSDSLLETRQSRKT